MFPNRYIFVTTVAVHTVIVGLTIFILIQYEKLKSQLLEHDDGLLISGGSVPAKELWILCLRLLQFIDGQAILLHAASIIIANRLYNDPYSRDLNRISRLWNLLTSTCLLTNMFAMVFFLQFAQTTYNTVQNSLHAGLEMYQFDGTWSEFWNQLQTHYPCCGVVNHTDWQGMLWRSEHQEAQFARLLLPDSAAGPVVLVPISCCRNRHHCTGERINLGVGELLRSVALDARDIINHAGCLDVVRSNLASTVRMITLLDVICCSLQLGAVFCMRLLFMANRNFQSQLNI